MVEKQERRIEYMPISSIEKAPLNPKDHDIGVITASVNRFGFADAVILDERTGRLVSGHGRIETLELIKKDGGSVPEGIRVENGEWLVPVQRGWASRDDSEATAFLIAVNRSVELGGYIEDNLEKLLVGLAREGEPSLVGTGFDSDDVDRIVNQAMKRAEKDAAADDVPEVKNVWVQPGDVFELGEHFIVCGDSTKPEDVQKVVRGREVDLVWTDPPYGVEYKGKAGSIKNDDAEGLPNLLKGAFASCFSVMRAGAHIYVAHPAGALSLVFYREFDGAGFDFKHGLVWDKGNFVLGHSDYHYAHEPIIYGLKPGARGRQGRGGAGWFGENDQASVLRFPKPARSDDHPTMKPIELVEACLFNSSAPGHVVFEPFSGSGTTLLACQRLGRACAAVELDPRFVQVAIERWEAATNRKAVKL